MAREAWKQEKLMSAYEARKKLEMIGAITLSSAARGGDEGQNTWIRIGKRASGGSVLGTGPAE